MTKAKAGKIAPYQLFFIIFVSRVVVTLTYVQTVSVGKLSTDLLISVLLSYALTMLLCVPIYLCSRKNKNPLDVKWIAVLYGLYFLYFSAENVCRFSYFATSELNIKLSTGFLSIAIIACACYASFMGIEGISRFGVFCSCVLIITIVAVVVFNIKNMDFVNIFPIVENSKMRLLKNSMFFTSSSIEPALFLALENKVNGDKKKPLFLGLTASYIVIFILILLCTLVMGAASSLQAFPIFTVFQLASIGSMSRLDVFHTAFWVLALFMKTAVLIYSSSLCIKKYKHSTKCVVLSGISIAIAFVINVITGTNIVNVTSTVFVVTFCAYCVAIPLLSLIFIKKRRTDDIIENQ